MTLQLQYYQQQMQCHATINAANTHAHATPMMQHAKSATKLQEQSKEIT
jgi:hypothetical protein